MDSDLIDNLDGPDDEDSVISLFDSDNAVSEVLELEHGPSVVGAAGAVGSGVGVGAVGAGSGVRVGQGLGLGPRQEAEKEESDFDPEKVFNVKIQGSCFTCGICHDIMNQPTTITCQHSFCYNCLDQLIKNNRRTQQKNLCPVCKDAFLLPKGSSKNHIIDDIIEKIIPEHMKQARHKETLKTSLRDEVKRELREELLPIMIRQSFPVNPVISQVVNPANNNRRTQVEYDPNLTENLAMEIDRISRGKFSLDVAMYGLYTAVVGVVIYSYCFWSNRK
jgi:hypothetical protein